MIILSHNTFCKSFLFSLSESFCVIFARRITVNDYLPRKVFPLLYP